jgi:Heterokaryon incompatibility protein (HET)
MPEQETYYEQYSHYTYLFNSASAGCSLCNYIYQSLRKQVDLEFSPAYFYRYEMHYGCPQIYFGCRGQLPGRDVPEIVVSQRTKFNTFRTIAQFEIFAKGATPSPGEVYTDLGISFAKQVVEDPCSRQSLSLAKAFMEICASDHKSCANPRYDMPLPARVLDVGPADGSQDPHLILSEGGVGGWVALSYPWGGKSKFVLNGATIGNFQRRIPLDQMPKTLRDAVVVTRALDIRYLWIDALCIRQDSCEDWAREAAKMCGVYKNAVLTIAAACANSVDDGFLHPRTCTEWPLATNDDGILKDHELFLRPSSFYEQDPFANSVLRTRGWVLQETILSPRILAYTEKEIVWQCSELMQECGRRSQRGLSFMGMPPIALLLRDRVRQKHTWTGTALKRLREIYTRNRQTGAAGSRFLGESWRGKVPDYCTLVSSVVAKKGNFHNHESLSEELYSGWLDIVQEYTSRTLSVPSDVLNALAGVAGAFPCKEDDEYCAGLWRSQLIPGLYWCREDFRGVGYIPANTDVEGRLSQIPSWSWASIQGPPATFLARKDMSLPGSIKHVCMVSRRGGNVFSDIESGHIRIAAPFTMIEDFRQPVRSTPAFMRSYDRNKWNRQAKQLPRYESAEAGIFDSSEFTEYPQLDSSKQLSRYEPVEAGIFDPSEFTKYPQLNSWIRSQWKANSAFRSEFNQKHTSFKGQEFAILIIGECKSPKLAASQMPTRLMLTSPSPPPRRDAGRFLLLVLESAQPPNPHHSHREFRRVGILQLDLTGLFGGIRMDFRNRLVKRTGLQIEPSPEVMGKYYFDEMDRLAKRSRSQNELRPEAEAWRIPEAVIERMPEAEAWRIPEAEAWRIPEAVVERMPEAERIAAIENYFCDEMDRLVELPQETVLV